MLERKVDFSKTEIQKVVLSESLQHPFTLSTLGLGILSGVGGALFSMGSLPLAVGGAAVSLALLSLPYNYFIRRDHFATQYVKSINELLAKSAQDATEKIEAKFLELGPISGAKNFCDQGQKQYSKSLQKYQNFHALLEQKFNPNELTFQRYLGTGEQVYLSILDNLVQVTQLLQSIKAIDIDYINDRKQKLEDKNKGLEFNAQDRKEHDALMKRVELFQEQMTKVDELLSLNEEAMTVLDHATAAVTQVTTGTEKSLMGLDHSMEELRQLSARIQDYSVRR